jgi:hypothetical protein
MQFSQSLRRKIKKYACSFIVDELSDTDLMAALTAQSYRSHGIEPPVSQTQLEKLFSALSKEEWARFYCLKKDSSILAGLLLLEDETHLYSLFAGVSSAVRNEFYTEYLYTECMKLPEFEGRQFDFLGANTQDFEQFKRSFGGSLQPYYELNYTKGAALKTLIKLRQKQTLLHRRSRGGLS